MSGSGVEKFMTICLNCNTENSETALFCENCDELLLENVPQRRLAPTTLLRDPTQELEPIGDAVLNADGIVLNIEGQSISVPIDKRIYIGRDETAKPHATFIDLTEYNAFEKGVSRLHALIEITQEGEYQIMDLGSSNGTRINNTPLDPFCLYFLPLNCEIRIGRLVLQLRFQKIEPKEET
jgi:pSer/pThr/pTyr-binding forkhead associated (FHA) protein